MDCSPPGFSVHGILQARILEWVAISFSISQMKIETTRHHGTPMRMVTVKVNSSKCGQRQGNIRAYALLARMHWAGQLSGQLNKMVQPLQKKIWLFLINRVIMQSSNCTP